MNRDRLAAFRARAQAEMEALFPATIKLSTKAEGFDGALALAAATGGVRRGHDLAEGFIDTDEIAFRVRKDLLPTMPEVGLRVLWVERSLVFRLQRASDGGETDPAWHLVCHGLNQGK